MEWAIPTGKKVRAPVAGRVGRQLHVPSLVRHARDDQAEAGPGIEPLVDQVQLAGTVAQKYGGQGGAQAAAAGVGGQLRSVAQDDGDLGTDPLEVEGLEQLAREGRGGQARLLVLAEAAYRDDRDRSGMLVDLFEEPHAIVARHDEVGQHDVHAGQERQRLAGRRDGRDRGALESQGLGEDLAAVVVVLHDEDLEPREGLGHGSKPTATRRRPRAALTPRAPLNHVAWHRARRSVSGNPFTD
jgi:hypothetical protein